jgi:hypothetical protein
MEAKDLTKHLLKDDSCRNCRIAFSMVGRLGKDIPKLIAWNRCKCKFDESNINTKEVHLQPPKDWICDSYKRHETWDGS